MQDTAIVEIGKIKGTIREKLHENYIENMFPKEDNFDMILAVFSLSKKEEEWVCTFKGIDASICNSNNYLQFAYRKGSARGGDITFTTKFGDMDKKFKVFYPKKVNDVIAFCKKNNNQKDLAIFTALKHFLEQEQEMVKAQLVTTYNELSKPQQMKSGFSVRFDIVDGNQKSEKYVNDFEVFQELVYKAGTEGKSNKYKVNSEGKNELCSICYENKPQLHGFGSPFKYATVDKVGMVSGFFKQKNNWKNYPICPDCALHFEMGKNYITQEMQRYFYGKSYYLVPQPIIKDATILKKALSALSEVKYTASEGEKIENKEEFIMRKIGQRYGDNNQFTLNLLFFEENQTTKAIKIKLMLEEILPSRFRQLFVTVPKKINAHSLYKGGMMQKKERTDLTFSFAILRTFFEDDFYHIVQTVFLGLPISKEVLYSRFMKKIRAIYKKRGLKDIVKYPSYNIYYYNKQAEVSWSSSLVKMAHLTLAYLVELGIIEQVNNHHTKTSIPMTEQEVDEKQQTSEKKKSFDSKAFKDFLQENSDFLNEDYKKGIFAVGVLVRFLLNIQSANLDGNMPFEKKLKGYNFDKSALMRIHNQALDKLRQYGRKYKIASKQTELHTELREMIGKYYTVNIHKLTPLSNNEISFYFVAGLELGNKFKSKKENNKTNK